MIPESVELQQTIDWKKDLAQSFFHLEELLSYCEIENNAVDTDPHSDFPVRVTRHFANLIEKRNPRDPLLLQVLASQLEKQQVPGYGTDPVGDLAATKLPGLIHKYRNRVLLTLTGACAIHCRYCFRRHFPYSENHPDRLPNGEIVKYLANNPEVEEVILSGGDPLMASDRKLQDLITSLNAIGHIRRLRIHSRVLSVLPQRVTAELIGILKQFNGQLIFVTHINHPNELEPVNQALFNRLAQKGITLFNQSVILRGINDDSDTLIDLSYKLFDSHVLPYYLHCLDQVQGSAHFDITRNRSCEIYRQMLGRLPGYLLPRLVEEVPGRVSKSPVQCADPTKNY